MSMMNRLFKPLVYGSAILMGLAGVTSAQARDRDHRRRHEYRQDRRHDYYRHDRRSYRGYRYHYYPRYHYNPYYVPEHPYYYAPRIGFSFHL